MGFWVHGSKLLKSCWVCGGPSTAPCLSQGKENTFMLVLLEETHSKHPQGVCVLSPNAQNTS